MTDSEQHNYCRNLVEVNKKQRVVTIQPIYNQQGVLLLAKGSDMDEQRSQVLLQHKLLKPLEECVAIASSLSGRQLYEFMNKFSGNIPGLQAVTANEEYQKLLRQMCIFYERHALLQQNLTVLALRARTIYYHGIFSAMAGLAIAQKLDLSVKEFQTVFIGGLFHDVGFLYLSPNLIDKTQGFTADEWKALQAHPLIAQRFLNMVPQLPKEIGMAIADHHERIDGTGFPRNLFGDKLSMASQIIAATDNIIFNHNRYKHYGQHAHKMLLTSLKLSDNIYFDSVYDAALLLFMLAPAPTEKVGQAPSPVQLLKRQQALRTHFNNARQLAKQFNQLSAADTLVRSINAVMGRLAIAVVRSGALQQEQEEWLEKMSGTSDEDQLSLLEISVMQDQILDQLIHLKNLMERIMEGLEGNEPHIEQLHADFNNFNLQAIIH